MWPFRKPKTLTISAVGETPDYIMIIDVIKNDMVAGGYTPLYAVVNKKYSVTEGRMYTLPDALQVMMKLQNDLDALQGKNGRPSQTIPEGPAAA